MQIIREADRGRLLQDGDKVLEEIVHAITAYGGTGEISIKMKIKAKGDAFPIATELKYSVPQPPRTEALFFFDQENGELSRRDPRQPDLPAVVEADFKNGVRRAADGE